MSNLIKAEFITNKEGKIGEPYLEVINRAKKLLLDIAKTQIGLGREDLVITDLFPDKDIVDSHVEDNTFLCITSIILPNNNYKKLTFDTHYKIIEINLSGLNGEYYFTNPILLEQNIPLKILIEPNPEIEFRGFKVQKYGMTTLEDKEFVLSILNKKTGGASALQ